MCRQLCKWLTTRWKWYVLGHYHCDKCPYCWSEWSYEGDGDCGCHIKGDIYDTCRLLPPFRFILGWPKRRYNQYWAAHQYDGMAEWYEQNATKEEAFSESIKILLKDTEIYQRDGEGNLIPVCKAEFLEASNWGVSQFFKAYRHYEDTAHPNNTPPLKNQWRQLIRDTWKKSVHDKIAPYLPKKRRKIKIK